MAESHPGTPNRTGLIVGLIVAAAIVAIVVYLVAYGGDDAASGGGSGGVGYAALAFGADAVAALVRRFRR